MSHVQTLIACALVALIVWSVQQVRVLDARAENEALYSDIAIQRAAYEAEARKRERVAAVEQAKNQPRPAAKPKNPNPTPNLGDP